MITLDRVSRSAWAQPPTSQQPFEEAAWRQTKTSSTIATCWALSTPSALSNVTKEMIIRFAKSIGETNPVFIDEEAARESEYGGIIAPPTFCNVFASDIKRPDIKLEFGDVGFHAGQAVESLAFLRPGRHAGGQDQAQRRLRQDRPVRENGV